MAKPKRVRVVSDGPSTMTRSEDKLGWRDLTYLDLFPYNPHYSFNGFRSLPGTALSLIFLFAVFLRIVTTIQDFVDSPPVVTSTAYSIAKFGESVNVKDLAAKIIVDGAVFNDPKAFGIYFEQAELGTTGVTYTDLGSQECSLSDPAGLIRYTNLVCPVTAGKMEGDFPLSTFLFTRVRVEECVNITAFDSHTFSYQVNGSTTGGLGPENACYDPDTILSIAKRASVQVYFRENFLNVASFTKTSEYLLVFQRQFLTNSFLTHQFYMNVERVKFESRYVFDRYRKRQRYLKLNREDESIADAQQVVGSDNNFHLNRMNFVFRLDRRFTEQIRDHHSIYILFESWAASAVFFTGVFGTVGWLMNRHFFREQTKGLDIRKMDRDQFDKFGRLVDKSFQMPRELQDMQAE